MSEVMLEKEETDVKDVKDVKDVEAAVTPLKEVTANTFVDARHNSIIDEIARSRAIQNSIKPLRYMRQGEEWLDAKMGVETQGIDRIPEEDKNPPSIFNSFFMWWSMTCHLGTLPIGILGPEFGLDLRQSIAAIVVGTFLGALCTAYTGTLGPKVREFPVLVSRTSLSNPSLTACLAWSPCHRYLQIFLWLLGRQIMLCSQRPHRRGFCCCQRRHLWSSP
jgi:hypothetical protein